MCDTIFASKDTTAGRINLFGKNSDRQPNEAQVVELLPAGTHEPGEQLRCTYIAIPQARRTHAVLLCRPFWMWGVEMGANEQGLVVGNEGLHARSPAPEEEALTGMDLVRLALERASTAAEALDVMIDLLERYGQGGNCGHLTPNYYNNGFLVADWNEAFVLETVGKQWLIERVSGVRSLSNVYSIGADVARTSAGLEELIREFAPARTGPSNYAALIKNPNREHIGHAGARRARSSSLLQARAGSIGALDMMSILRDHGTTTPGSIVELDRLSLCMHAGPEQRPGQTTGSLVSELYETSAVHWVTATAAPCISIFKPVLLGVPLPWHGPELTDRYDPSALWWRHEGLHRRAILGDFMRVVEDIGQERDELESRFHSRVKGVIDGGNVLDRTRMVAQCWVEASEAENRWRARIGGMTTTTSDSPHSQFWKNMNKIAGMEV